CHTHLACWRRTRAPTPPARPRPSGGRLAGPWAGPRRNVCVIAGVDLAHVGPRFGDPEPNTPEGLAAVRTADLSMLEAIVAGDPIAFYASVAHDGDRRRICGLSPIYTFLRALPGASGRLLRYE